MHTKNKVMSFPYRANVALPDKFPVQGTFDLSVVIPAKDEAGNLPELYASLTTVLEGTGLRYEIIFVDDGSIDETSYEIEKIQMRDKRVRGIELRANFGQTPALAAGIDAAQGNIVVLLDADLQNDPRDIPFLIEKLNEGYDVVSGWRKDRKDKMVTRRIPSVIANFLIARLANTPIHDLGCALKAYRREILDEINLYGDMHRYLPIYARMHGARIAEIIVNHHPRRFGKSKYGLSRIFKVIIDVITIQFFSKFITKPMRMFGSLGLGLLAIGGGGLTYLVFIKVVYLASIGGRPLLVFSVLFILAGLQLIGLGVLCEVLSRNYFESQGRKTYSIRRTMHHP